MFPRIMWLGAALILSIATVGRSQSPVTLAQAIHQFQVGTVPERVNTFYALDREPGSWTQPGATQALLALVEREDKEHDAILRGLDGNAGEDYEEYDGQLLDRCYKYCDREALLTHLLATIRDVPDLKGTYVDLLTNTYADAGFSPAQRSRIASLFIAASHDSTSFLVRASGLGGIGVAIRSGLASTADRARLHQAVIAAASDPNLDVRLRVVLRLSELHDPSDSSLLRRMSVADTARRVKDGKTVYPVRDAARAALAGMRKPAP